MKPTLLCAVAAVSVSFVATPLYGQSSDVKTKRGTTAVPFLEIGVGPRGVAMGESYVAVANEASALYWNPAGIAQIQGGEALFAHTLWFADVSLSYAAAVLNLGDFGNVGASFYVMNSGEMAVTTEERPEGNGETFHVQDFMVGLSYARKLTDRVNIGGTLKFIQSNLWRLTASTIAVDGGLQFATPLEGVSLALSISNFGGEMQYDGTNLAVRYDPDLRVMGNNDGVLADIHTKGWNLPLVFRFGLAYHGAIAEDHSFTIASDVLYPNNNANFVNVGAEYEFMNKIFLRGGFKGLFMPDREGGLSLGIGLFLIPVKVDYSYTDMGRLAGVERISATVVF